MSPASKRHRGASGHPGPFRVERVGMQEHLWTDTYHRLLSLSWPRFVLTFVVFYYVINVVFAFAYWLLGPSALEGIRSFEGVSRFMDDFFFSVQTFATIGYGRITPVGTAANLLVTAEALVGLMMLALATGLFFSRFSRPTARVVFSRPALLGQHDGVPSFVFRLGNARQNQIVEAQIRVIFARNEKTAEGESYRNFYDLELERDHSAIFALSWTVVHPIQGESPFLGPNGVLTEAELKAVAAEVIVSLVGIDDTFSETIHARYSYFPEDMVRGGRFRDILERSEAERVVRINLPAIHDLS